MTAIKYEKRGLFTKLETLKIFLWGGKIMNMEREELLEITAELAWKYTSGESTSISWEKARTLMEAVLYCLEEYNHACPDLPARKDVPLKEQYQAGQKLVYKKVNQIREEFNSLTLEFQDYGVKCLYDTVQKGIPEFLKWYDAKFSPQDPILTLDYPVLTDHSARRGADAVWEYIQAIQAEQAFLRLFPAGYVEGVLGAYDPAYGDMVENICEIMLMNAIGHGILHKPLEESGFKKEEYGELDRIFSGMSMERTRTLVRQIIEGISMQLFPDNTRIQEYLLTDTENIAVRIHTTAENRRWNRVFL